MQPRLLLVSNLTELEWVIKPELEQWAEVAAFDVPGVGAEPPVEPLDRQAIVNRALQEVDRRDWNSYTVVCDGSAFPIGVRVAHARCETVEAMALGHARLVNRMEGERPTVNREVMEAFAQLTETNHVDFIREARRLPELNRRGLRGRSSGVSTCPDHRRPGVAKRQQRFRSSASGIL
jgi:hypothetical protein